VVARGGFEPPTFGL